MSDLHVILGTGAIGRAAAEELVKRGKTVRMVNRSGVMAEALEGAEVVATDLYDPVNVREATRGAKVVYQCSQPRYSEWPQKFPPLQDAIIEGLTGSGAKLVIVENLYMYGAMNGRPLSEDMPHKAHTRKGTTRSKMSKAALAAHQAGKVRVAIARGSDFFGPWGLASTMGERVFYPLLLRKAAQVTGRTDLPHTHTFTRDFGKAMAILGERDEADGQVWHVPNDIPEITQSELIRMFCEEAGVEAKITGVGKFMLGMAGLFIPEAKETVEMLYEFNQPFIVDSSRFEGTFGMKPTPMWKAIQETVAWYKSHPKKN